MHTTLTAEWEVSTLVMEWEAWEVHAKKETAGVTVMCCDAGWLCFLSACLITPVLWALPAQW